MTRRLFLAGPALCLSSTNDALGAVDRALAREMEDVPCMHRKLRRMALTEGTGKPAVALNASALWKSGTLAV